MRIFFKTDTFKIQRSKNPAKNTILMHLQDAAKGTGWDKRFAKAIKQTHQACFMYARAFVFAPLGTKYYKFLES